MILNISKFIDEDYRVQGNRLSRNFIWATLMLAFVVIVIPNSVRFISIPLIFFAAALALVSSGRAAVNSRLLVIWILSTFVTLAYVCIGILKGYFDAVLWTLSVYVVGPMLWLLICSKIFSLYSLTTVIRTIILFGVFGGISVFILHVP